MDRKLSQIAIVLIAHILLSPTTGSAQILCRDLFVKGAYSDSASTQLGTSKTFDRQKLFDHFSNKPTEVKNILSTWFGRQKSEFLVSTTISSLGEMYLPILLDPGVSTRFNQFIRFATEEMKDNAHERPGVLELRQKFSAYLGSTTVYRALALNNTQEANQILQTGIASPFIRSQTVDHSTAKSLMLRIDLQRSIEAHQNHQADQGPIINSPLISVSKSPSVAAAVASTWNSLLGTIQNKKIYIFRIELPLIETVSRSEEFSPFWSRIQHGNTLLIRNANGQAQTFKANDPSLELFVPFEISPDHLRSGYRQVESNQYSYEWIQ